MKNNMKTPLAGIQIIELGHSTAISACCQMLSDYGADVIKIDTQALSYNERASYAGLNRGKNVLLMESFDEPNLARLSELISTCDALITDSIPLLSHNQFGYSAIHARYPHIVYTLITGFGISGSYFFRSTCDAVIQAESGIMSITGEENTTPVLCGAPIADYLSGCLGCIGTLMVLLDTFKTGEGRLVDVSAMDTLLFGLENQFSSYLRTGNIPAPIGNNYCLSAPVGVFPCKDGEIVISVATESQWQAFSEVLGHPEWITDSRFSTIQRRIINYPDINTLVKDVFSKYTFNELTHLLQSRNCIYGRVSNLEDVLTHPQVVHRHTFTTAIYPDGDTYHVPLTPLKMNDISLAKMWSVNPTTG